jgi:hypothetical protein
MKTLTIYMTDLTLERNRTLAWLTKRAAPFILQQKSKGWKAIKDKLQTPKVSVEKKESTTRIQLTFRDEKNKEFLQFAFQQVKV